MKRITRRKKKIILKRFKAIGVLLVGIMFSFKMVDAGSNDSVIERNRIDNIYAVTNYDNVNHLFYLNMYTMNGIPSYCIEVGVDINTEIYNSTSDFSISNLSSSTINYLRNLSYFGYGYSGHNDYRYYMAVQELMWEHLKGIEVEWTNTLDFKGERINIESYKNDILRLVNGYNKGVDLRGYSTLMDVNVGDKINIGDINNNLKYYEVISSNHSNARIVDNMIYVDFDEDYVGIENIVLKRKDFYGYLGKLYYQGTNQKMISNGDIDEEIVLSFDINGMGLSLQVIDGIDIKKNNQYDYSGISFELYNESDELVGILECDSGGKLFIDNLPYGNYYVKQLSTNDAYLLNEEVYSFEFHKDMMDAVILEVTPVIRELELLKLYGDSSNLVFESSVIFDIYNMDGTLYDSVITDYNGIGKIDLPYGEYIVNQASGRDGYYMVDDFYVNVNKDVNGVIKHTLVDNLIETNIVINSRLIDSYMIEEGVRYKIKKKDSDVYLSYDEINEFYSVDGQVNLPFKLSYGEYVIEVLNDSKNYLEVKEALEFKIDDSSNFYILDGELYLDVDVFYELVKGNVEVNTYIEEMNLEKNNFYYDYVVDDEVHLSLIADRDIIVNNEVVYSKGDYILDVITNNEGKYIIEDIYLGDYCLVDLKGDKECFKIDKNDTLKVSFKKDLDKGEVIIHNVSNNLDDIEGTVIELYNNNNLIYTGITNNDGIIKVNDLSYGEYCFLEKSVNHNYLINDDKVCFVVNSGNLELEITNEKVNKKYILVPDTFSDKKSIKKLLVLCLLVMGGSLYKIKISKKC